MATHEQDSSNADDLAALIRARIEGLRPKLLDLSRRNPLIATQLSGRGNSYIRVVDELPDVLYYGMLHGQVFRFGALPALEDDPKDEKTDEFQTALSEARLTDESYAEALEQIDPADESAIEKQREIERALRDKVRAELGMPARQTRSDLSLVQHARNNGISPSYELPRNEERHGDGRHEDDIIQTLLLSDDLERAANRIIAKCRSWQQETGLNVMHAAFGFLEWEDAANHHRSFSPLILLPIEIERTRTPHGPEFLINGLNEPGEMNNVLAEKLRLELSMELPTFEGGSVEDYLSQVDKAAPRGVEWKVRRYVTFGVFPSARLAMYHDLDTARPDFATNEIVDQLLGGRPPDADAAPFAKEYEVDAPDIEAKVPLLVTDADSSQFSTMVDVANGKNLAVEGPPGTGKSQTIINTIAAALSDGKKVLFVAEKMAALDVVRARLEHMQLGEFLLPLQANRSSREHVVASIRDRLDLKHIGPPNDYEWQIRQFKKAREELASYINVISSLYGTTNFTVHDILGRAILTADALEGLPRGLQAPNVAFIETCDRHRIEEIKTLAEDLEKAWEKAASVPQYWNGLSIEGLDRFTADDLLIQAEDAAKLYRQLDAAQQALVPFGITADPNAAAQLQDLLLDLEGRLNKIDADLVHAIIQEDRLDDLGELLEDCQSFRENHEILNAVFDGPFDHDFAETLRKMVQVCAASGIDTLDADVLRKRRDALAKSIGQGEIARQELAAFINEVPELKGYPVKTLAEASELVGATPRDVLALRNETTADAGAASLIERAARRGDALTAGQEQLAKIFDIPSVPAASEISRYVAALSTAGLFSALSSEYRAAKRAYRTLSRGSAFNRNHALSQLTLLAKWKSEAERFQSDPQLGAAFGVHFNGIDTNFERFLQLLAFYDAVEHRFPGLSLRHLRKFLKTADLDLVQSLPSLEIDDLNVTYDELEEELARRQAVLERLDEGIAQVETPVISRVRDSETVTPGNLQDFANLIADNADARNAIEAHPLTSILGNRFAGVETRHEDFEQELAFAHIVRRTPERSVLLNSLLASGRIGTARGATADFLDAHERAQSAVAGICESAGIDQETFLPDASYSEIADQLDAAANDRDGINAHAAYYRRYETIRQTEVGPAVQTLLQEGHGLSNLPRVLEAFLMRALSIRIYREHGDVLEKYRGDTLEKLREQLALTDRQVIENSRLHLRAKLVREARPPSGNGVGRKSTWTELALLENEARKSRGYYPVRDVTWRAGSALLELKPCWMMSPLAIAQYLPRSTVEFDLCIIDEASQMPPENAIGALLRAKQVMIVGDTNQLPPTNFFRKLVVDEDADEDETVVEESVLEIANSIFRPARRLRWHYRSRNSALIRFSNRIVYDDDLIVFPSAAEGRKEMGVSLVRVDGTYKSGANAAEAQSMVEAAIRFMHEQPNRSLGIVTLNQKQRDLIQEELEYAIARDRTASRYVDAWAERRDGLESFFIKNLENVQGDERDVIFIGTVYGPQSRGAPVFQRFGPINGVAGKRRLNVLFTRAKQQIVTFSSMTTADITADENGNPGAYMLKRWLEYSATGRLDVGETTGGMPDSDFEMYVAQQIRAMGCEVVHQVGVAGYFIDIGVKHPEFPHGFLLGVECDGATYHSAKSARDRDRLRQEVLESLGWHFHRVWSTDWFSDPQAEAAKLRRRIEERLWEEEEAQAAGGLPFIAETDSASKKDQCDLPDAIESGDDAQRDAEEINLFSERTLASLSANRHKREFNDNRRRSEITVGDTVRVRYLTDDQATLLITISDKENNPRNGIVHVSQPLAQALMGAEVDEEVEVLVGPRVRLAKVEEVIRSPTR